MFKLSKLLVDEIIGGSNIYRLTKKYNAIKSQRRRMRTAVIDIGTNSIKMLINDIYENERYETIADYTDIVQLGRNLRKDQGISTDAANETINKLLEYKKICGIKSVDNVFIIGTMCLRNAVNSLSFIQDVRRKIGWNIKVLSGEEEAEYSYKAIQFNIDTNKNFLIFDSGGGSTEFILGNNDKICRKQSIDFGAIQANSFLKNKEYLEEKSYSLLKEELYKSLDKKLINEFAIDKIIGIGGAVTNLAAILHKMKKYDPELVNKTVLSKGELLSMINLFNSKSLKERSQIVGLQPKRANLILGSSLIVKAIFEIFFKKEIYSKDYGLRHGFFYSLLEKGE